MNQTVLIAASRLYFKDALWVVRANPSVYVRGIVRALYGYFHSSSDNDFLAPNPSRISTLVNNWNALFYGQFRQGENIAGYLALGAPYHLDSVAWLVVMAFLFAIPVGLFLIVRQWPRLSQPVRVTLLFLWWNVAYVTLVGNLFDLGENNRFRFVIDPIMYTLAFWAVLQVFRALTRRIQI